MVKNYMKSMLITSAENVAGGTVAVTKGRWQSGQMRLAVNQLSKGYGSSNLSATILLAHDVVVSA